MGEIGGDLGMLKVLIVDDHPMMRQGIKGVLETQDDFQVVAEAEDGDQALSAGRGAQSRPCPDGCRDAQP